MTTKIDCVVTHVRIRLASAMLDALQDILVRQWNDLLARPSGPMSFRFLLQPAMALLAAAKDGLKDARTGRSPYFWTIVSNPAERKARLHEGFAATSRIIILGLLMDAIYQIVAFRKFYPLEAIIIALFLAFVPYLIARGPIARIARWWRERHTTPRIS
jgi:hypothetical protein